MKSLNTHRSLVCPAVSSRLNRTSRSFLILAFTAVFACLLSGSLAQAQVNQLRFNFEDAPGNTTASDTSLGGVVVTLGMQTNTGAPLYDAHGAPGSGVLGAVNNSRALNFANRAANGGITGPVAAITNASLGFGTVSTFTITLWMKQFTNEVDPGGNTGARVFVMGPPGVSDVGSANCIGMKYQANNQLYVGIGATATFTAQASFAQNLPTNKWLFIGITYDGTNVKIYQGSDSASVTLVTSTSAPGLSAAFGANGILCIGNRPGRARGFDGWIDDFRFYTGTAGSASFVEGVRASLAPLPIISGVYPDGTLLDQATNKFAFHVSASPSAPNNITNVSVVLNGVDASSQLLYVTNGAAGTSTNLDVSYNSLAQNVIYNGVITVTDASGAVANYSTSFDTFNGTNYVVEAEEFDHDSGQFIDNADYTSYATNTSYFGLASTAEIDTHKGSGAGSSATDYRTGASDQTQTQTPPNNGDQLTPRFINLTNNDPSVVQHYVGFWSSAEWQNYTRTFPAGKYNIYGRLAAGAGAATLTAAHVTSGQTTSSQTTTNLGTFSITGTSYAIYQWIPLRDGVGNLAAIDLGGQNTVRMTSGGGVNSDFYMLVPANTNLPSISAVYPNGATLFQATNKLVFTASSPVTTISSGSIIVTLNGTNISGSLVFSGGPSTWNVSYTGLQPSQSYTVVITVTDANGSTISSTLNIDTWSPVLQIDAEDFDFGGGQYIDNPVPTTSAAGNSYFGQVGVLDVDEHGNTTTSGYPGASVNNYRPNDYTATTLVTDAARSQFISAGAPDYNLGFLGGTFWQNYTKTFTSGTYNVYARIARGDPGAVNINLDQITGRWGMTSQFTKRIGTISHPGGIGWSAYSYRPVIDPLGNYANLTVSGTNTLRATENNPVNINFYMLVPARTDLPRIDNIYPDGSVLLQATNKFSFTASSPTYGVNTNNIKVTLNGVNVSSNLVFSGSSASWNASYSGLLPNTSYTAVINMTDNVNQAHSPVTVSFDTFSPTNYTWEGEDFDFDPTLSPVAGTGSRFIDNPVPGDLATEAGNVYFGQTGASGIDEAPLWSGTLGTYVYRSSDYVSTEVTSDAFRQNYINTRVAANDPGILDYDVNHLGSGSWIDYTRTFPSGYFNVYARVSAGNGAFKLQCAQVTSGAGTSTQTTNVLGNFIGTGASFATWQYVPLVDANANKVVLSLGGVETLQMMGDTNENANFFMLIPVAAPINTNAATANFTFTVSGGGGGGGGSQTLNFNWAPDHLGWQLYSNSVGLAATGSWFPVPGSGTVTNESITTSPSQTNVFFQLRYP